jgi:hypothetical protein
MQNYCFINIYSSKNAVQYLNGLIASQFAHSPTTALSALNYASVGLGPIAATLYADVSVRQAGREPTVTQT